MKRKYSRGQPDQDQTQSYDLILTDVSGRSIRAHKALLIDKSDYFAKILSENNLSELQLNENYLIELIHYLYNQEFEDHKRLCDSPMMVTSPPPPPSSNPQPQIVQSYDEDEEFVDSDCLVMNQPVSASIYGDIEILMQLLVLSRKYAFQQLYQKLLEEINYKLGPESVLAVYRCSREMDIDELRGATQMMILSWLPQLQKTQEFLDLPEEAIYDIFQAEQLDVESESKLNALSAWWTRNQEADMTNLWVQLIESTYK